jgi:hypothetical protein
MASATEATQSAQPQRPSRTDGVCSEFTVLPTIKQGHAAALREDLTKVGSDDATRRAVLKEIGTLHTARWVMFDNDTRFLFASVFDGSWDNYIDDFGASSIGPLFDELFGHCEGYPGMTSPKIKEWFESVQVPAFVFTSAYPDLTTQQIWKDQEVNEAFQAVLDSPEFRAALDNPANKGLVATPAFQKLLEVAAG